MNEIKRLNEKIFSLVPPLDDGGWIVEPPVSRNPGSLSMDRRAGATGRRGSARPQMPNFALALSRAVHCRQRSAERFTPLLLQQTRPDDQVDVARLILMNVGRHVERAVQRRLQPGARPTAACAIDRPTGRAAAASGESMNLTARRSNRRTVHALTCGPRFHQRGRQ